MTTLDVTTPPDAHAELASHRLCIELIRRVLAMSPTEIERACWKLGIASPPAAAAAPWRGRPSRRSAFLRRRLARGAAA
ncbi:MAG TPA: hypothetical protein PLY77_17450 [Plasticicumulans sp.]|uniref:hypothetical protein n=1 Tax=Plasticicumulans sp. TaxID=2307179 RepID=UPI002CE8C92A|nr:hypothetical protein [Plasticicumulans sp.]